ncbi:hypothetical protein [Paenibacillus radicis (ex Xue et al. 2023)]|uniref:Uncharacterized protein n=1 Tax=Paenibacillus radicis (ex Xue et al. 2023) TaxID=2972489 RepID=A0ABT1Y926_9BACL|nr:hypothetical protein [Paenibacillus radicis (ex Xue et al. 2023)]MCR8629696.1 hypothetical protein [Paenibacillus radicis (ex Xue et al. 2023)]
MARLKRIRKMRPVAKAGRRKKIPGSRLRPLSRRKRVGKAARKGLLLQRRRRRRAGGLPRSRGVKGQGFTMAYNKAFDQAYNEGFSAGFAKGLQEGP